MRREMSEVLGSCPFCRGHRKPAAEGGGDEAGSQSCLQAQGGTPRAERFFHSIAVRVRMRRCLQPSWNLEEAEATHPLHVLGYNQLDPAREK